MSILTELNAVYPSILTLFILALGACWGSFLNVVVYRLPLGKSVVTPGSCCTTCGKPIRWFDNIPVLSWFVLRGKSRCCRTPFSIRYPIVEAVTALLFLGVWQSYGIEQIAVVPVGWVLVSLLLAGALIDYDTQMLPDVFTVWGMVIGVLLSMLVPALHGISAQTQVVTSVYGVAVETTLQEPALLLALRGGLHAAIGAVVGAGTLLWIAILAEAILRKEAMGFGDVLLMGCIGAFCGWQGSLFAIFGGALIGCIGVAVILIANKCFGLKLSAGKTSRDGPARDTAEAPAAAPTEATATKAAQNATAAKDCETATKASGTTAKASSETTTETNSGTAANASGTTTETSGTTAEAEEPQAPELGFGVAIPFGPWLAAGAIVYFLFLREPTAAYIAELSSLLLPA